MTNKVIGLDLSKRDGFNKAITGRVGDKDNVYSFRLFNNGVLFDLTKASQIALLGLTPSGYYVDAVGFPQVDGTVTVEIPSAFNAEMGYFQRCFIRVVTTTGETLSTQDLIYYSYGNADISAGGGKDYIGRVEALIEELNKAADEFKEGLDTRYNEALADLQDLTNKMNTLEDRMDALEAGGAITKPEADANYMKKSSLSMGADDWNTYQEIGTYGITTGTGANAPVNSSGTLLVQGYGTSGTGRTQVFINSNSIRYRQYQGGGNWTTWQTLSNLGNTDGKYMNIIATPVVAQDWNTLTTIGTYSVQSATGANRPSSTETWGTLLVQSNIHNSSMATQLFIGDTNIYFRRKTGATNWNAWRTPTPAIASSGEVNTGTDNTKMVTPKALADSNYTNAVKVNELIDNDKSNMLANKQVFVIDSKNSTYINSGSIKLERVGDTCYISGIIKINGAMSVGTVFLTSGTMPTWFNSDSNRNAISIFAGNLTNIYYEASSNSIKVDSKDITANSWVALNASSFPAKTHL